MPSKPTTIAEYLGSIPAERRRVLAVVCAALKSGMPGVDEKLAYGMPAYRFDGEVVLYVAGWKDHFSIYPADDSMVDALGPSRELAVVDKGTIRFSYDRAPSRAVLKRLGAARLSEVKRSLGALRAVEKPSRATPVKRSAARRARASQ